MRYHFLYVGLRAFGAQAVLVACLLYVLLTLDQLQVEFN